MASRWMLTAALVLAVALGTVPEARAADDGKTAYTKKCATCHGDAGEGKAAIAKAMKVALRPLGAKEVQARSDADLAAIVTNGFEKMKPVKGLSEAEVKAIVAHMRTFKP